METFSCSRLIRLFCCPPCPNQIANKVAFAPPTTPSYEIVPLQSASIQYVLHLSPEIDNSSIKRLLQQDARLVKTSLGNEIVVIFLKCTPTKVFTVIYSHGNAVDVGYMHRLCTDLSLMLGCDVVTYDYSGYGQSTGKPSEKNIYADIKSAWDYTLTFREPNPNKIILYGQSIGTVPTVDLASKVSCAGVILQSPLSSAQRYIFGGGILPKCGDTMNK